jgi:hypothetical protein
MRKSDATQLEKQETDTFDAPTDLSRDAVVEINWWNATSRSRALGRFA